MSDVLGELGDFLIPLIGWLLEGVELFVVKMLPIPWNLIAQGAVDIMQAIVEDLLGGLAA